MKDRFALQVAVVVILLVAGLLCIPVPEGGTLLNRLTGHPPAREETAAIRATPEPVPTYDIRNTTPPPPHTPSARFKDALPFRPGAAAPGDAWTRGTVNGKTAWRDNKNGMIWGPKLKVTLASFTNADLEKAQDACAAEEPKGSWAVPTAAEFDLAKVNGILDAGADTGHRWLAAMELPSMTMGAVRGYVPLGQEIKISLRCIGRSSEAPIDGYKQTDMETTLKAMSP